MDLQITIDGKALSITRDDAVGYWVIDSLSAPLPTASLREVERWHIERSLALGGTMEAAAERLGISAQTLWRRRTSYGMELNKPNAFGTQKPYLALARRGEVHSD